MNETCIAQIQGSEYKQKVQLLILKEVYLNMEKKLGMGCVANNILGSCNYLQVLRMYEEESL